MHFSWMMPLFIVLLFSRFSLGNSWYADANSDEDQWTTTTESSFNDQGDMELTTTPADNGYDDTYDSSHEHEDEKEKFVTTFSSSSNAPVTTTNFITKTTTTTTTEDDDIFDLKFVTSTLDPQEIAIYIAKANRERLLLKIFTITVAIGMSVLSVALFTIHLLQKSKHYRGYRAPADPLPPKSSV